MTDFGLGLFDPAPPKKVSRADYKLACHECRVNHKRLHWCGTCNSFTCTHDATCKHRVKEK